MLVQIILGVALVVAISFLIYTADKNIELTNKNRRLSLDKEHYRDEMNRLQNNYNKTKESKDYYEEKYREYRNKYNEQDKELYELRAKIKKLEAEPYDVMVKLSDGTIEEVYNVINKNYDGKFIIFIKKGDEESAYFKEDMVACIKTID